MHNPNHCQPLVDAIAAATGHRPHLSTALRWCQRGVGSIKLKSWKIGGRRMTTVEAVREFIELTTAASDQSAAPTSTQTTPTSKAHEAAMRALREHGL